MSSVFNNSGEYVGDRSVELPPPDIFIELPAEGDDDSTPGRTSSHGTVYLEDEGQ